MAVTVRAHVAGNVAVNSAGGSASVTANKPNGLAVGDVWLIHHTRRSAAADTATPAGFTQLGGNGAYSSGISKIYYKVADSADVAGGAKAWTQSTTDRWQTVSVAIAGADVAGTIFDAESPVDATDATSPYSTAGLTPNSTGMLMALYANATVQNTWTAPTTQGGGWTEHHDVQMDGGASASRMSQGMSYKATAAGGATGAISVVGSSTAQSTVIRAIHINEAPAGDTTAPTAPTGLNAADGPTPVLTWTQGFDAVGVTRNKIKRSTVSGSGYVEIADIAANTTYTDTSAAAGTTYYYVVTALDAALNESPNSAQDAAGTPSRVTDEIDVRWRTYARVSDEVDLRWRTYQKVSDEIDIRWRVEVVVATSRVTKDIDVRWRTVARKSQEVILTFPSPPAPLIAGAGVQAFKIEMRKVGSGTPHPDFSAYLYEGGVQKGPNLVTNRNVASLSQTATEPWDAANLADLSGSNVQLRIVTTGDSDRHAEVVDVEWLAVHELSATNRIAKDIDFRWLVAERTSVEVDLRWSTYQRIAPKEIDFRWRTYARAPAKDIDLRWRTYERAPYKEIDFRWRTYARAPYKEIDFRWRTYAKVSDEIDLRWRTYSKVSQETDIRWRVAAVTLTRVEKDIDVRWRAYERAPVKDTDIRWRTYERAPPKDLDIRWRTYQRAPAKDLDLRWRTYALVSDEVDLRWRTFGFVPKDIDIRWRVLPVPGKVVKDLDFRWRTYSRTSAELDLRWRTYQRAPAKDIDFRWRTYAKVSDEIDVRWRTYQRAPAKDIDIRWRVAGVVLTRIEKDIDIRWRTQVLVYTRTSKDIDLRWRTGARIAKDITILWRLESLVLIIKVRGYVKPKTYATGVVDRKVHARWYVAGKVHAVQAQPIRKIHAKPIQQ